MKTTQVNTKYVNHITGTDALDYILEGNRLYFPDGNGMKAIEYDDVVFSYFFINYEDQRIRTNWNDAHIANKTWEVER